MAGWRGLTKLHTLPVLRDSGPTAFCGQLGVSEPSSSKGGILFTQKSKGRDPEVIPLAVIVTWKKKVLHTKTIYMVPFRLLYKVLVTCYKGIQWPLNLTLPLFNWVGKLWQACHV